MLFRSSGTTGALLNVTWSGNGEAMPSAYGTIPGIERALGLLNITTVPPLRMN